MNPKIKKKILDIHSTPLRRFKTLLSFTETATEQDKVEFYEQHFSVVYKVFLDTMHFLDGLVKNKKGNKTISTSEVVGLSKLVLALFKYATSIIKKKWQQRSIIQYVEIYLETSNAFAVKKAGFDMLLGFIDIMEDQCDTKITDLFLHALSLGTHIKESDEVSLPTYDIRQLSTREQFRIPKSNTPVTEEESLQMISAYFDYFNQSKSFEFWWEFMFKKHVAPILYPTQCKELKLLDVRSVIGFIKCPYKIHLKVIQTILMALRHPSKREVIYKDSLNIDLVLKIFRQSFVVLPPELYSSLKEIVDVYASWVNLDDTYIWPETMEKDKDRYFHKLIEALTQVFCIRGSDACLDVHMHMAYDTLKILQNIQNHKLEVETVRQLQKALIDIYENLIQRYRSQDKYDSDFGKMLETSAIRDIFLYWIKTSPSNEFQQEWDKFYSLVQTYFDIDSVFLCWKASILNMTNMIIRKVFHLPDENMAPAINIEAPYYEVNKKGKKYKIFAQPQQFSMTKILDDMSIDTLLYLWHWMFYFYGKSNMNRSSPLHTKLINVMHEVLSRFLKISTSRVIVPKGKKLPPFVHSPEGNTLFELFGKCILEGCLKEETSFLPGRCIAYTMLCQLLCQKFATPWKEEHLGKMYQALQKGLVSEHTQIVHAILQSSWNIFSFGLKGMTLFLPDYVYCCEQTLKDPHTSEKLQLACIRCLTSVISMLYHFKGETIPPLGTVPEERKSYYRYEVLRPRIRNILMAASQMSDFESCQIRCIWSLSVLLYKVKPEEEMELKVITETLLSFLFHDRESVAFAAHDVFTTLAHLKLVKNFGIDLIGHILVRFCAEIHISLYARPKIRSVIHLFYTLVEFISEVPPEVFENSGITQNLFQIVSEGIDLYRETLAKQQNQTTEDDSRKKKGLSLKNLESPDYEGVAIAAEVFLSFSLNMINSFPTPSGATRLSSEFTEFDILKQEKDGSYIPSPDIQHFLFNDSTIFTVMESPSNIGMTRIIVRDMTGRYCWEFKLRSDNPQKTIQAEENQSAQESTVEDTPAESLEQGVGSESKETNSESSPSLTTGTENKEADSENSPPSTTVAETKEAELTQSEPNDPQGKGTFDREQHLQAYAMLSYPHYYENIDTDKTDMLELLSVYTQEIFHECSKIAAPAFIPISELNISNSSTTETMKNQIQKEDELLVKYDNSMKYFESENRPKVPELDEESVYKSFRRFLNNLGFIHHQSRFHRLHNDENFLRNINHLDNFAERETIKVGVIYVKNQQETQSEILQNSKASDGFCEFCQNLGWEVDLSTHRGFMGGLTKEGTTGKTSFYYSNPTTEVMFHVVPFMPTKPNDSVQLIKKRHVGNDFVHIIWTEHDRDYRPWTMPSQFNFFHIIIYPINELFFRIQIFAKDEYKDLPIPDIGPLQDGMIVDKHSLAELVRQTAINANKACRYNEVEYLKPYPNRRRLIEEIRHFKLPSSKSNIILPLFVAQDVSQPIDSKKEDA